MQRLIALLVCVLLGTPTFIMAQTNLSGDEPGVPYAGSVAQTGSISAIGSQQTNVNFLTFTMSAGNKQGGFSLAFESDYVFNHDGDPTYATVNGVLETTYGVSVVHNQVADGHNQPFQLNANDLLDGSGDVIATSSSTDAIGVAQALDLSNNRVTVEPKIQYTNPQRSVTSDDTIKIGLTTAANALLISGTYVAEITVTIADI